MLLALSLPWTAYYTLFTVIGHATFSVQLVFSQPALYYFLVSLGTIWTLLTPLYLSLALGHAKARVLARYGEHIDVAFRKPVENSIQENADRYR